MRQTSRAVALLLALESAQATATAVTQTAYSNTSGVGSPGYQDYGTSWSTANPAYAGNTLAATAGNLSNRQGAYQVEFPDTTWSWTAPTIQKAKTNAVAGTTTSSPTYLQKMGHAGLVTATPGSGCMQCLGASQTAVWCSRTYSFLVTTATTPLYQYEQTDAPNTMQAHIPAADGDEVKGTYDGGSCCDTADKWLAWTGKIGTAAVTTGTSPNSWNYDDTASASAVAGTGSTCVALMNTAFATTTGGTTASPTYTTAFGQAATDNTLTAWSSWWCSNGLYKTVTSATAGVLNATQLFLSGSNQRRELARVGCPQKALYCGKTGASAITAIYSGTLTSTAVTIEVAKGASATDGLPLTEKCTWAAGSYAWAPTFAFSAGSGTGAPGLVGANWQIHTMEYTTQTSTTQTDGSLEENGSSAGYVVASVGVSRGTYLPLFTVPAAQFATLRTWYGDGGATPAGSLTGQRASWYAPGRSGLPAANSAAAAEVAGQQWGNVAHMPSSTYFTTTTSVTAVPAGSAATYGALGTAKFDLRVVRYMPAQVAQSVWTAGNALLTAYNSELSSYNTAKTTWDAYVAILTKNAKMDAFAAAFSPPKAPTVPPLPNKPWTPPTYSGFVKQTAAQSATMLANSLGTQAFVEGAQPTAQQFWTSRAAAETIGGWGSWTAHLFTYRAGWGKSFGTIGYSGATGTAGASTLSAVWKYQWTCGASSTATQGPTVPCDQTYSGVANTAASTAVTGTTTPANAATSGARLVVVVSLWSLGDANSNTATLAAAKWDQNSFALTWTGAPWSTALAGLSAIAAPTAATAAASLSGIAGAEALAASAAAALAAAAALY